MNLPEIPKLSVPIKIYYYDTDAGGVVNNISYMLIVEVHRTRFHRGKSVYGTRLKHK